MGLIVAADAGASSGAGARGAAGGGVCGRDARAGRASPVLRAEDVRAATRVLVWTHARVDGTARQVPHPRIRGGSGGRIASGASGPPGCGGSGGRIASGASGPPG